MKAKAVLKSIAQRAKAGNPDAIKAARLVKKGMEITGIRPQLSLSAQSAAAAAGEPAYLAAIVGACATCAPSNIAVPPIVGCGAYYAGPDDSDASAQEIDALEEFATSGAFEGIRWAAARLAPHAMTSPGAAFTKRDALLLGLQVQAAPRH